MSPRLNLLYFACHRFVDRRDGRRTTTRRHAREVPYATNLGTTLRLTLPLQTIVHRALKYLLSLEVYHLRTVRDMNNVCVHSGTVKLRQQCSKQFLPSFYESHKRHMSIMY